MCKPLTHITAEDSYKLLDSYMIAKALFGNNALVFAQMICD
jgi:hypothetical protein